MNEWENCRLAIRAVELLSSATVIISSIEMLTNPSTISNKGLSSWPVSQLASRWTAASSFQQSVGRLLVYPHVLGLFVFRLVCAIILVSTGNDQPHLHASLTGLLFLSSVLLTVRSPYGHDGADQMSTITFLALAFAYAIHSTISLNIALWFVALQSCLSYFTAGYAKLVSPLWRSGKGLEGILKTSIYGHRLAGKLVTAFHPLAKWGSWLTISFECLFVLTLAGIPFLTCLLLGTGILFHLLNAIFMRLNTFFWSFLATYPAVLYCAGVYFN
ncbi:MAG: hypothetical protein INR73_16015 [Williamsia sp.]|nr:hypothetical protein [Williamsia sp.]